MIVKNDEKKISKRTDTFLLDNLSSIFLFESLDKT